MRSTFRDVLKQIRCAATLHPAAELLLESLDGQLSSETDARIGVHVADCIKCQKRLSELREGIQLFDHSVAPLGNEFSVDEGLKQLLSTIHHSEATVDHSLTVVVNEEPSPEVYDRLLSELSIYVGRSTAKQLLVSCAQPILQRDRLVVAVEPVVSTFFGQHTGAAVVANVLRIWDHAQQAAS